MKRFILLALLGLSALACEARGQAHPPLIGVPGTMRVTIAGSGNWNLDGTYACTGGGPVGGAYCWSNHFTHPDLGHVGIAITAGTSNMPNKSHVYVHFHTAANLGPQWRAVNSSLNAGSWNVVCTPGGLTAGTATVHP